jgi:hypothetical protein
MSPKRTIAVRGIGFKKENHSDRAILQQIFFFMLCEGAAACPCAALSSPTG